MYSPPFGTQIAAALPMLDFAVSGLPVCDPTAVPTVLAAAFEDADTSPWHHPARAAARRALAAAPDTAQALD